MHHLEITGPVKVWNSFLHAQLNYYLRSRSETIWDAMLQSKLYTLNIRIYMVLCPQEEDYIDPGINMRIRYGSSYCFS